MAWRNHDSHGADGVWVTCVTCWGQRRLLMASADGRGLVPATCPGCLGVGERLAGGGHVPAAAP